MKDGACRVTYDDGSFYDGNYVNDKKSGNGQFVYCNNDRLEGEFNDNEVKGKYFYSSNGDTHEGRFIDSKAEGTCIF